MEITDRIVFTGDDGRTKVSIPTPEFIERGGSINDILAKLSTTERTSADVVDISLIPTDRTFREAWNTSKGKAIDVNMVKAKVIAQDNIRLVREEVFKKLDIAYQIASESNDTVEMSEVVAKKMQARNAPEDPRLNADDETALKFAMEAILLEVEGL